MATPVQNLVALVGALRNENTPNTTLVERVGLGLARSTGSDLSGLSNAQIAALALQVARETLRSIVRGTEERVQRQTIEAAIDAAAADLGG